ncbi:unnamed protein product [Allacma fusca]|uniref:Potassium channel domain-containing protein n=1 Tax=Allacma fusca TaxID=39272 RepID=A0A8J2NYY1_9HEXA|nr:unnamed protein product [Allacma fusca]
MQSYISVKVKPAPHRDSLTKRKTTPKLQYQTKSELRRAACKSFLQKTIAFLFTQVGCGALLVGYTILGAVIFIEVESPTESRRLFEVTLMKKTIVGQLWNVTQNYNVLHTERWRTEVELIVEDFQNSLVREIRLGYDGSSDPIWTFPSALMYSLSVFTTIGYGNLTPKTDWGKALTIFYALFGIPLLLLYFSNVGNFLATSLREFYSSFNRCKASLEKMKKSREMERTAKQNFQVDYKTNRIESIGEDHNGEAKAEAEMGLQESQADNDEWTNEVTIPISTCLAVFSFYILMGSLVFSWWENWNYLDGSYFCFISLVTIGFGDLVPADSTESQRSRRTVDGQLIFCSIYLLVGMGLMAMLFHLTQERFFLMARPSPPGGAEGKKCIYWRNVHVRATAAPYVPFGQGLTPQNNEAPATGTKLRPNSNVLKWRSCPLNKPV